MHSPTDASPPSLRTASHGSGPTWIATPSSYRTCTDRSLPVSRRTAKDSVPHQCRLSRADRRLSQLHTITSCQTYLEGNFIGDIPLRPLLMLQQICPDIKAISWDKSLLRVFGRRELK